MLRTLLPLLGLLFHAVQAQKRGFQLGAYTAVKMTFTENNGSAAVCLNNVQLFKEGTEVKYSATITDTGTWSSSYYPKYAHQGQGSNYWCSNQSGFSSNKAKQPEVLTIKFNSGKSWEFDMMKFKQADGTGYAPSAFTVHGMNVKTKVWDLLYDNKFMKMTSGEVATLRFNGCDEKKMVYYNNMCYYVDGSKGKCVAGYKMAEQSVLENIGDEFAGKQYYSRVSNNCCIMHSKQSSEKQNWGASYCNKSGSPGPIKKYVNSCKGQNKQESYQLTLCYGGFSRPKITHAPTGASCSLAAREHDTRNRCQLYDSWKEKGEQIEKFKEALGQCKYEEPRMIMLMRNDFNIMYLTSSPQKAFSGMNAYFRKFYKGIDKNHPLEFTYTHQTRDGKKRKFTVSNDMDLWSAFQMQEKHRVTELYVYIDTDAPTSQPTTATPTQAPTQPTHQPTYDVDTSVYKGSNASKDITWIKAQLKSRKNLKIGTLLYRMSVHGKAASYFHAKVDNKGKHLCVVRRSKVSNDQVFGSFSDISWNKSSGYGYCNGCFLFIHRDGKYTNYVATIRRYGQYGVYRNSSYGPCFGGGHDYCINSPSTPYGYTSMGYTWKAPNGGYPYYYGGTSRFDIADWECWTTPSLSG